MLYTRATVSPEELRNRDERVDRREIVLNLCSLGKGHLRSEEHHEILLNVCMFGNLENVGYSCIVYTFGVCMLGVTNNVIGPVGCVAFC